MTPGPLQLLTPHSFYKSVHLKVITELYYNNHDGTIHVHALY